ncbi:MAG: hypothetical protein IV108_02810, partial [Burkholderiales bacterium]|nr:hypothetical protein [Burkholderiales bacterium]
MSIKLEDHADILGDLSEQSRNILNSSWHEAARVFSPLGLENYLQGAMSLKGL